MGRTENSELKESFFASLRENELTEKWMEFVPDVLIFIKDEAGRFMMTNQLFWEKLGRTSDKQLFGLTDEDVFSKSQAQAFRRDDATVMRTGRPQIAKLEIIPTADGLVGWYRTTKIPLRGRNGSVRGILGITRDLRSTNIMLQPYRALEPVIQHILLHYPDSIHNSELAEKAGLSLPHFTRCFRREFRTSPNRYISMVRLNVASRLLAGTDRSISEIALDTGFSDPGFFTKQFSKHKGLTPREFRKKFRGQPDSSFPLLGE